METLKEQLSALLQASSLTAQEQIEFVRICERDAECVVLSFLKKEGPEWAPRILENFHKKKALFAHGDSVGIHALLAEEQSMIRTL